MTYRVRSVRSSRQFATRFVEGWQRSKTTGRPSICVLAMCDFQKDEEALLDFSCKPTRVWAPPEELPILDKYIQDTFDEEVQALFLQYRELHLKTFDTRMDPEADGTKTLCGALPTIHPERRRELLKNSKEAGQFVCAEWTKPHQAPQSQVETVAALRQVSFDFCPPMLGM